MLLKAYLKKRRLSKAAFADQIGMHKDIVFRWLRKDCYPTRENAKKIVAATNGKVTLKDIYA